MLLRHLYEAERHVAEVERHLARREELVAELHRDGQDTKAANEILSTMRQSQALHLEHRDHIIRETE
ncbi:MULTISPECIES: hypothetical protein [Bradyrhizobium]|uniref:hypothetical protein n=1 Tax=Bradyrhizobium TaxID=374 RepID=UPI001E457E66|nr:MULTISPECIES: hypothetical protein [Bradyrhizobium]UFW48503.1 hypothetical protein BaraCB756_40680 [Bradyrhizobium arachidis]